MKHIQQFESFKKKYGQTITPTDFSNIKDGKVLIYKGSEYTVVANNGYSLDLKNSDDEKLTVNLNQFNVSGQINEDASIDEAAKNKIESVLIKNATNFKMGDIYEFLAGYTSRLRDKIEVTTLKGNTYDTIIVKNVDASNIS
jgi:hypothetical protein